MKTALCKLVMDDSPDVIITITLSHLDKLEGSVLYLRVRVIKMEVEEVKDLSLVHLTPADLVVLKLVSVKSWLDKKLAVFLSPCPVFGSNHLYSNI